jgi:hypothetical protein
MDIHVCKQCGLRFAYCRACVFKPIYYKDYGFCSKECYDEFQKEVISTEDVEVIITDRDISTSE